MRAQLAGDVEKELDEKTRLKIAEERRTYVRGQRPATAMAQRSAAMDALEREKERERARRRGTAPTARAGAGAGAGAGAKRASTGMAGLGAIMGAAAAAAPAEESKRVAGSDHPLAQTSPAKLRPARTTAAVAGAASAASSAGLGAASAVPQSAAPVGMLGAARRMAPVEVKVASSMVRLLCLALPSCSSHCLLRRLQTGRLGTAFAVRPVAPEPDQKAQAAARLGPVRSHSVCDTPNCGF